jgi:hypothetical protein
MPNINIAVQLEYAFYTVILIICASLFGVVHSSVSAWQCHQRWKNVTINVQYHLVRGCQIKILDEWTTEEKYERPEK